MKKIKLSIITLLSFTIILISCEISSKSNVDEMNTTITNDNEKVNKTNVDSSAISDTIIATQKQVDSKAQRFMHHLKTGAKLSSFFKDNWVFIYHEDNRCDGSTDGQINTLKSTQIDSIIELQVINDGEGWACDKKKPKTYDLNFDLKKKIEDWDRFEMPNYDHQEANIVYILGKGESDYLKLHYDNDKLIIKLEYRSEDPG